MPEEIDLSELEAILDARCQQAAEMVVAELVPRLWKRTGKSASKIKITKPASMERKIKLPRFTYAFHEFGTVHERAKPIIRPVFVSLQGRIESILTGES